MLGRASFLGAGKRRFLWWLPRYCTVDFPESGSTIFQGMKPMGRNDRRRSLPVSFYADEPGEDHAQAHRCRFHESG